MLDSTTNTVRTNATPLDKELNAAILHLGAKIVPTGFEVVPQADDKPAIPVPNNALKQRAYMAEHGRPRFYAPELHDSVFADAEVESTIRGLVIVALLRTTKDDSSLTYYTSQMTEALGWLYEQLVALYGSERVDGGRWMHILAFHIVDEMAIKLYTGDWPDYLRAVVESDLATPEADLPTSFLLELLGNRIKGLIRVMEHAHTVRQHETARTKDFLSSMMAVQNEDDLRAALSQSGMPPEAVEVSVAKAIEAGLPRSRTASGHSGNSTVN